MLRLHSFAYTPIVYPCAESGDGMGWGTGRRLRRVWLEPANWLQAVCGGWQSLQNSQFVWRVCASVTALPSTGLVRPAMTLPAQVIPDIGLGSPDD